MAGRTDFECGGFNFHIKKFPPLEGLRIVGDLQKRLVGPAASLIATQRSAEASDNDFAEGLRKFSQGLDGDAIVSLYHMLVKPKLVSVDSPSDGAMEMSDATVGILEIPPDVLLELSIEVAKVNFSDFIKSVRGLFGTAPAATEASQ